MKALSTRTRCKVGRPAEKELAPFQQASPNLHEETWAGLLTNQGRMISKELEIIPGCAVSVACPYCPGNSPVSPGQAKLFGTCWAGHSWRKQIGLGYGCSVVPSKGRIFLLPLMQQETGKRRIAPHNLVVPHSVGAPLRFLIHLFVRVRARPRYRATYWRAVLATARRCVEGYRTPDEAMVC